MTTATQPYRGPWTVIEQGVDEIRIVAPAQESLVAPVLVTVVTPECYGLFTPRHRATAALIAAAPNLLNEAKLLRMLATSPRFQGMTVAEALAELALNGFEHDGGTAIAKATGEA